MEYRENIPDRIVIYTKDVENLTGRKKRAARLMLQTIRKAYGKTKGQFVTIREFCEFTGMGEDEVRQRLAS